MNTLRAEVLLLRSALEEVCWLDDNSIHPSATSVHALKVLRESEARDNIILINEENLNKIRARGRRTAIKQQHRAIAKRNRIIYNLRYDNPAYRKWCHLYGTDPKVNPWIDNTGAAPRKMPHEAWIDIMHNDGSVTKRVYAMGRNWYAAGLPSSIMKWRFHNSKLENDNE